MQRYGLDVIKRLMEPKWLQKSANTYHAYSKGVEKFVTFMGGELTRETFNRDAVARWIDSMVLAKLTPSTIRLRVAAVRHLAKWMEVHGYISQSPFLGIEVIPGRAKAPRFLTPNEVKTLLTVSFGSPLALAIRVLLDTGLRASEFCALKNADFTGTHLRVRPKGLGGDYTYIPVSREVAQMIRMSKLRDYQDPEAPLFRRHQGKPWERNRLSKDIAWACKVAGIGRMPVRAHILRHTANVLARHAQLDATTRSRLMNHRSPASLQAYEHLVTGELEAAREAQAAKLREWVQ